VEEEEAEADVWDDDEEGELAEVEDDDDMFTNEDE